MKNRVEKKKWCNGIYFNWRLILNNKQTHTEYCFSSENRLCVLFSMYRLSIVHSLMLQRINEFCKYIIARDSLMANVNKESTKWRNAQKCDEVARLFRATHVECSLHWSAMSNQRLLLLFFRYILGMIALIFRYFVVAFLLMSNLNSRISYVHNYNDLNVNSLEFVFFNKVCVFAMHH